MRRDPSQHVTCCRTGAAGVAALHTFQCAVRVPPLPRPRIAVIQYVNVKADAPPLTDLRKEQLTMRNCVM